MHIHTTHSDGACTPAAVVMAAHQVGLSALAITDHDTVTAIACARPEAARLGIELIAGIEWTVEYEGKEIHLLGYFIDVENQALVDATIKLRNARTERIAAMAERLRSQGLKVDLEALRRTFPRAALGRRHLAEWLRLTKQVAGERDAFIRYLGDNAPANVAKARLDWTEAIALTRNAGGVAGLAHPPYNLREATFKELVDGGLGAIEAEGPGINPRCGKRWQTWAAEHGIVPIAGSDFHTQAQLGRWIGVARTSLANLERLRAARAPEEATPLEDAIVP